MPDFELRLRVPSNLSAAQSKRMFFWTSEGEHSFVSNVGRSRLGPSLGALGPVPQPNTEFVRLAAAVYAADRSVRRRSEGANWSQRQFALRVPVWKPDRWTAIAAELEGVLGFLSGDEWALEFVSSKAPKEQVATKSDPFKRVVLLSGGGDSATGALVSRNEPGGHLLLSHYGPTFLPGIQRQVAEAVQSLVDGDGQEHTQVHLTRKSVQPNGQRLANEFSTRARSLLFLGFGLAVASLHGVELWVPENGFASLNPPIGPDRRGSLSTRTTHPTFLQRLSALLTEAGVHAALVNPFALLTKGEVFGRAVQILGKNGASKFLSMTHSCAHTGHRAYGVPITHQCGVCFGCALRKAAFAAAGIDDRSKYLSAKGDARIANYLQDKTVEPAVRAFLDRGLTAPDLAALALPPDYSIQDAKALCERQISELRLLFP